MSIGTRGFIELLIDKIRYEGILSSGYHSSEEIESDVIDMVWEAYGEFNK